MRLLPFVVVLICGYQLRYDIENIVFKVSVVLLNIFEQGIFSKFNTTSHYFIIEILV